MRKILLSIIAVSALGFASAETTPAPAIAPADGTMDMEENGFYAGGGIQALSMRDSEADLKFFKETADQDRLGDFTLNVGYWFTEYLAVEGRYTFGFSDADVIELSSNFSIFLRPTYKFDDDDGRAEGENYFAVYGLLGFGSVSFKGVNQVQGEVDNTGFQWGLGISYTFRADSTEEGYRYRDNWTVFAEYVNMGRNMEGIILDYPRKANADALSLGIVYHF